jgi:hypothetical protein
MKHALASLVALSVSLSLGTAAYAQGPADVQPLAPVSPPEPSVAITVSPIHLLIPMAEVTAEVRLAPKLGLAMVGGVGRMRIATTNELIGLVEGGGSLRYYVTGSFRSGVQLGAEALYLHASTDDMTVDVRARGLAISPFVGFKWTHRSGFTFDGQIGASYMATQAKSATQTAEKSKVGPMLNLNVGWSL